MIQRRSRRRRERRRNRREEASKQDAANGGKQELELEQEQEQDQQTQLRAKQNKAKPNAQHTATKKQQQRNKNKQTKQHLGLVVGSVHVLERKQHCLLVVDVLDRVLLEHFVRLRLEVVGQWLQWYLFSRPISDADQLSASFFNGSCFQLNFGCG